MTLNNQNKWSLKLLGAGRICPASIMTGVPLTWQGCMELDGDEYIYLSYPDRTGSKACWGNDLSWCKRAAPRTPSSNHDNVKLMLWLLEPINTTRYLDPSFNPSMQVGGWIQHP
jgi:hypothetical protein